jgi:type 1 fimbria pilin
MKQLKLTVALLAGLAFAGVAMTALADDSKTTTITGSMVCGKCTLHITDKCQNVVQVTQDGKTVNYFLKQNDVSKSAHDPICGGDSEKVKVTGTLTDEDGKKVLTPTKIEVVKG